MSPTGAASGTLNGCIIGLDLLAMEPIDSVLFNWIPGWIWLGLKTFAVVTMFLWVRASFPRFRYDQIMRLGWKIFIPVTLVWLVVVGGWMQTPFNIWK